MHGVAGMVFWEGANCFSGAAVGWKVRIIQVWKLGDFLFHIGSLPFKENTAHAHEWVICRDGFMEDVVHLVRVVDLGSRDVAVGTGVRLGPGAWRVPEVGLPLDG